MKIPLFIIIFVLIPLSMIGQTYSVIKGSVLGISTKYDVVNISGTSIHGETFNKGEKIQLTESWAITTTSERGSAHLLFSNKMDVFLGGKTTLWIDNFEQFSDKDEKGQQIPDDGSFTGNFRLNGSADFKLDRVSDSGYFSIMTNQANLEVKSSRFHVRTIFGFTIVECYSGEIVFTDSITMKTTILKSGESAQVFGKGGELNTIIKISPLTIGEMSLIEERLN